MIDMNPLTEIKPTSEYADNKQRKFYFMCLMGNDLSGYARVATIQLNGDGFDDQGKWVKGFGLVLEEDLFVHESKIKPI